MHEIGYVVRYSNVQSSIEFISVLEEDSCHVIVMRGWGGGGSVNGFKVLHWQTALYCLSCLFYIQYTPFFVVFFYFFVHPNCSIWSVKNLTQDLYKSWSTITSLSLFRCVLSHVPIFRPNCPFLSQMDGILMHPIWAPSDSISKSILMIPKQAFLRIFY